MAIHALHQAPDASTVSRTHKHTRAKWGCGVLLAGAAEAERLEDAAAAGDGVRAGDEPDGVDLIGVVWCGVVEGGRNGEPPDQPTNGHAVRQTQSPNRCFKHHAGPANSLPELRLAVGLGELHEDVLRGLPVLVLAGPRLERRALQRAAVGEGQAPRRVGVLNLWGRG